MGASTALGVTDSSHQVFGTEGLYVMDGSSVPGPLGVNPQVTIMALATRDLMQDLRSADPFRQGGGKMFSKADRSRFLDVLDRVLRAK